MVLKLSIQEIINLMSVMTFIAFGETSSNSVAHVMLIKPYPRTIHCSSPITKEVCNFFLFLDRNISLFCQRISKLTSHHTSQFIEIIHFSFAASEYLVAPVSSANLVFIAIVKALLERLYVSLSFHDHSVQLPYFWSRHTTSGLKQKWHQNQ